MGRHPNTANLGLETAGVSLVERANTLSVEEGGYRCVGAPTVWGAGDVLGAPGLASTGVEQAKAAVAAMFGEDSGTYRL